MSPPQVLGVKYLSGKCQGCERTQTGDAALLHGAAFVPSCSPPALSYGAGGHLYGGCQLLGNVAVGPTLAGVKLMEMGGMKEENVSIIKK